MLHGRSTEVGRLVELLEAARAGQSGALVVRGEAGIGKTALLNHVASSGDGALVLHAEGVEAEMELPFAALQQLCAPLLGGLDRLPAPQRDALQTAFGLSSGPRPDRFLVGHAQWLDRSSAQVLSFVARRLGAEGVFMLFAERDTDRSDELAGLPDLR